MGVALKPCERLLVLVKNQNPVRGFSNRGGFVAASEEVIKRPWLSESNIGDIEIFSPLTCPSDAKLPEQLAQGFCRVVRPRENGETILIFQND